MVAIILNLNLPQILEIHGDQEQISSEDAEVTMKTIFLAFCSNAMEKACMIGIQKLEIINFNKAKGFISTLTREKIITTNICTTPSSRHWPSTGKP